MNKCLLNIIFFGIISSSFSVLNAEDISISIKPDQIIQGDPIMITINEVDDISKIKSLRLGNSELKPFLYNGIVYAMYGVDINKKPGSYIITTKLSNNSVITKEINIESRKRIEAPLDIPKKLGGNTASSQKKLIDTLAIENLSLLNLRTGTKSFWREAFRYPVSNPVVTDDYGYIRQTGSYTIAHKGTDFRAEEGTKVYSMNQGVVRVAKTYRNYGKTIVVDHGLGVMTFYMHLSKINVAVGNLVKLGQVIGLSGKTGYAESPHLHLTVRINDVSVDPVKFMELFK